MNEFVAEPGRKLTPQQTVVGVLGITLDDLVAAIQENRDGQYDHLFVTKEATA